MKKFSKPVAIEQESNAGQYCIKPEIIEKIERLPVAMTIIVRFRIW